MRIAILAAFALLTACASTGPILVSKSATNPATLGTFRFLSSEAVRESGSSGRKGDAKLEALVIRELGEKGYAQAAAGTTPDFIMTYRLAVFTSENPRDAYAQIRDPSHLIGSDLAPDPAGSEGLQREATLVLMAQSGVSEKVIWQAVASGVTTSHRELSSAALRAAQAMLDRFPARAP
jgi:hypothetical protein